MPKKSVNKGKDDVVISAESKTTIYCNVGEQSVLALMKGQDPTGNNEGTGPSDPVPHKRISSSSKDAVDISDELVGDHDNFHPFISAPAHQMDQQPSTS